MIINFTLPGRLHVIRRPRFVYLTIWLFGRRYHWTNRKDAFV